MVALNVYLSAFKKYFAMAHVTEICINRPKEVWVEQEGKFLRFDEPNFTETFLMQFAQLVAEANEREISREHPTLSSVLPRSEVLPHALRVQFVIEPACEQGSFICSIRQKSTKKFLLSDYFSKSASPIQNEMDTELLQTYFANDYESFLKLAVLSKKNIIISGGTSTGKTTVLNSLISSIPLNERLITIETDREVEVDHPNVVHLLAAQEGRSVAETTMLDLLKASLRLRPDRILVSELRAEEAFPYLRAINSGHPGSITTLHADSPSNCFNQLAFMVLQGGIHLTHTDILHY
ncbi:MAG: P-type DNA transfer ATPase VirB11, partial [Gammaproteobacteria bacterium]|nr:P-type DNA transfer ATPase VirB11 [Gammaproteobacteria bacterium]